MFTLGKIFCYLYVIRVYKNGDGHGFVWRWWNPVAWICAPVIFLGMVYYEGVPFSIEHKYMAGFGLDPYFIKNPKELEWL